MNTHRGSWTVLLALALGCATPRTEGWKEEPVAAQPTLDPSAECERALEHDWERRDEEPALRSALAGYAEQVAGAPADAAALVRLSRGTFFLAHAFAAPEERVALWDEGTRWAEKALASAPAFRALVVDQGKTLEEALPSVGVEQVDALYWMAVNLGNWVGQQDAVTRLKYLGRIKALLGRLEQLAPDYHQGAIARYWGGFYAEAPALAGGSLKKSRESFERALQQGPRFYENRVLYAELYAVKAKDRELFRRQLEQVLAGGVDDLPELRPEQVIEQRRARELLGRIDELFH